MIEDRTEESIDVRSEQFTSLIAPPEMMNDPGTTRFIVSGLRRLPQKVFFPTLAIGAAVVVFTVVMFVVNVLGK